ncbi:MAG TPA: extracellular solute-binding protein [Candidatus Binatia bacterium]|nr:extracellular solute-binding protein [Candidatus Binatia bacterium]
MVQRLLVSVCLFVSISSRVAAQDTKLLEAARKEGGKVVAYGSLENTAMDPIVQAFERKTGLRVEYFRASATKAMERALAEHRAGKPAFDVMVNNSGAIAIMKKEGLFSRYISPSANAFPKDEIDPEVGPAYRHTPIGIIYNKSVLRPADAPKSLEDLLNPKYRGKFVMPDPTQHTTTMQWLASLYKILGNESAEKFIRDLGATKPILAESFAPSAERVSTGETPIAISLVRYVVTFAETGAPVDYVRMSKMLSTGQYVGLNHKAPRPNAGKAFIDFFLSAESMKLLAKAGEFVTLKGIPQLLPDADKIQAVEMDDLDTKGYAAKRDEFKKLFLR